MWFALMWGANVVTGVAVLLLRPNSAPVEVLNDINGNVVNLSRCVRHHLDPYVSVTPKILQPAGAFPDNDTLASSGIILPDAGPWLPFYPRGAGRWRSAFTGTLVVLITLSWI
ncbi:hypothetical protein B9J09_10175 [Xylella fastidiosa subsp. pauca]|nr:hypothetical protein B9J09_10175 [Xylella fastidiosa subsp. pauca]AVI21362.1 hypothetical protein BCV75_09530 [Xylella fastidiosa]AVI23398.1 hypothetical protein BC375_09595 [Xylella fastidiosa]KIA58729.1 hypothetical protein RA12_03785 [Xylella fastidiosa]KXB11228.1 hypothetical protein ADT32_06215 [Xylella fastidiosa]